MGQFCNELRRQGVFTNPVTYPAVRRKESRVRLNVNRSLTRQDMDYTLTVLQHLGQQFNIIPGEGDHG